MRMKGNAKRTFGNLLSPFGGPEQGFQHCLADITEVKLHLHTGYYTDDWVICLCDQTRSYTAQKFGLSTESV